MLNQLKNNGYATAAREHRRVLARRIKSGTVVITAAQPANRSRDTNYHPYRFDSYLYYLSACTEPQTALFIQVEDGEIAREVLLCRRRDPTFEKWQGEQMGLLRAKQNLLFDETADIAMFPQLLAEVTASSEAIYFLPGADSTLDKRLCELAKTKRLGGRGGLRHLKGLFDVSAIVDEMRLFKDKTEIMLMQEAALITCAGHKAAMHASIHAKNECEVAAAITASFIAAGGQHAFAPIAAAGTNALTLHYTANHSRLNKKQLLLLDAGCEWHGYAGDVSRTFPVRGSFSPEQADVYDVVLEAQKKAIKATIPGAKLSTVENTARRVLAQGIVDLGLVRKGQGTKSLNRFYVHKTVHWLGLDVHDVGNTVDKKDKSRRLEAGMVITVEPGLYIPNDKDIPHALRGICVRIEDDVLLNKNGNQVLSIDAPKTRPAIEKWMNAEE